MIDGKNECYPFAMGTTPAERAVLLDARNEMIGAVGAGAALKASGASIGTGKKAG